MGNLNERIATLRRRLARQEGFSIIEVVLAFGVLFIALLALARTATVAFSDVSFARQRQTANQLANQLMEEIRALPYDTIKKGLSSTDLNTTDPTNILSCGAGVYRYKSCATGEKIVYNTTSDADPLAPHLGSFGPPTYSNTYAWRTYVTEAGTGVPADTVPSKGAYRVTVVVDWNPTARGGAKTEVGLQTLIFSPQGCIDTTTHPFGAPCQAYFYGTGSVGGGTYTVTGSFFDESFDSMSASLLGQSADMQLEQVSRVEGDSKMPSVSKTVSGTETLVSTGVATGADSDPATGTGTYDFETLTPQTGGSVVIQDGGDDMTMSLGSNATGTTTSTVAAGGTNSCNLQVDSLPCGYATGRQIGSLPGPLSLTHVYDLTQIGTGTLFSVGSSATDVTTFANKEKTTAPAADFVRESVTWSLPEIRLGAIPSAITPPTGWAGYWVRLTGFTATAQVEAGVNAAAPSISITGGTVEAWNGNGYTSTTVSSLYPLGGDILMEEVHESTTGQNKVEVDITGTVSVDASPSSSVTSGTSRTESEATIGAPLTVEMNYVLTYDNDEEVNLNVLFTAGSAELSANYTP